MVSGSLALLYFLLGFHGGKQGSGPNKGQSPVDWGDFLSVHPSVWPSWLAGPQAWLDGPEGGNGRTEGRTDEQTNKRTYGRKISPFYRTSSPIGAAALPPPMKTKEKVEQGKGTADHLMPLGYLFSFIQGCNSQSQGPGPGPHKPIG